MKSLILRIGKKILLTGQIDGNDVIRLMDYDRKHPMWRTLADEATLKSFDAIMAQVKAHHAAH
jgi:hypothetical protein